MRPNTDLGLLTCEAHLTMKLRSMVVVTVAFIVLGLIVLPILYGLNTEAKAEAKITVSGYDGVLGLKDVEEPDEKTAATLPKAANGDFRFMINDQNYAISPYGGVYVADEDLEVALDLSPTSSIQTAPTPVVRKMVQTQEDAEAKHWAHGRTGPRTRMAQMRQ